MILSICDVPDVLKVVRVVKIVINIIKIVVPIILLVRVMMDFTLAITSHDNDALNKASKTAVSRGIAAVLVFLIPTFVTLISNTVLYNTDFHACLSNATKAKIIYAYEETMESLMKTARREKTYESLGAAKAYLINITDKEKKEAYLKEIDDMYAELDEAAKKAKEEQQGSTVTIDPAPGQGNDAVFSTNNPFAISARNTWMKIVNGGKHFTYSNGNNIPLTGSVCDCSAYVSWAIYDYGYTDWAGYQRNTVKLYDTNYTAKYGWYEKKYPAGANIMADVRPGDIVVRVQVNSKGEALYGTGHTNITSAVQNGRAYAFDCGSNTSIQYGVYFNGYDTTGFYQDGTRNGVKRVAKIIRIAQ